jgi:hypothetical protein
LSVAKEVVEKSMAKFNHRHGNNTDMETNRGKDTTVRERDTNG